MGDIGMLWLRRWKARTSLEVQQLTQCFSCRAHGFDPWSGSQDPTCYLGSQTAEGKKWGKGSMRVTEFLARSHFPSSLIQCWYPPQLHLQQTADVCFQAAFRFLLPKTNPRNKVWFGSLTITRPSVWIRNHEPFFNSRRKPLPKGKDFLFPSQVRTVHPVKQSAPRKWLW